MSGTKIQQTTRLSSTQEHCSTRVHLQEMGYKPCLQGSFTRQRQTTSKRSKICCNFPKGAFTEYIAVTKQICNKLGENTDGVDCSEYYQKTKDLLQNKSVHPIPTSPNRKGKPSKPSRKMTHR